MRESVFGPYARSYTTDLLLLPVKCGACGWTGKRKPGNIVMCPKCGAAAAFQSSPVPDKSE